MDFQNKPLTTSDFNEQVSGIKNFYKCWSKDVKTARKELTNGKNLICLTSVILLRGEELVRDYIYIGFHKTLEDFFTVEYDDYQIRYFFFIPVGNLTEGNINDIILDIKAKNTDNTFNFYETK